MTMSIFIQFSKSLLNAVYSIFIIIKANIYSVTIMCWAPSAYTYTVIYLMSTISL